MGGYGSGQHGGRPTVDASRGIDLAWMLREGLARPGQRVSGALRWSCGGSPSGSISYDAVMDDPEQERLQLSYTRGSGEDAESVRQTVYLCHTQPNFGGKRWWMICPYRGNRAGKLYLPPGGDRFASRKAWRLAYQSQRDAHRDRPFERLFRLQKKLGCEQGWGSVIRRPKGMWHRTFERHWEEFLELDDKCAVQMMAMVGLLNRK
jgi:hypothetical protein